MALDMAKYRRIFLEESADHLAEISRALFDLEKEMDNAPAIDTIFRMAHSIKSMAVAGRRAARHASFTSSGNPNEVAVSLPVPARMMPSTVDEPASAFAA